MAEVLPPPVGAQTAEALAEVARTGEPVGFEYVLPLGEERRDFEARLLPLDGAADGGGQVVAVVRDVTERKATEEALRASEASYRGLFDHLSELVYVQDLEGRFLAVNEAVIRAYGYRRSELIGQMPDLLAAPGTVDPEVFAATFARALAGEPQRFEWWGRRKDGSIFPKEVTLQRSTYFGQDVVIAVARDVSERVEAEAALRQREEHFRRLIENASDLIQVVSPTAGIVYTSPSIGRLLGYTPEEIAGASALAFMHPDDLARVQSEIEGLLAHPGTTRTTEYRVLHRDGRWRHFEARGRTLSPTDASQGFVVNARDVTERVEVEEALRQREERFRQLIENAHDITCVLDTAGAMTYLSPSISRVLGWQPEELEGRSAFELMHPDDVPDVLLTLQGIVTEPGATGGAEYRFQHKDGRWRLLAAVGRTLAADSAADGVVVNVRDVTERKEAEAVLRFQKTLLEAQGEASIDGILVVSEEGGVLSYNRRFVELWAIPPDVLALGSDERMMGAVLDQIEDPDAFRTRVAYLYAHPDEEARDEVRLRDGRVFDRYSAPVRSGEGEHYGRIWFFRDVTAETRHADELDAARQEAEAARERADRYAASLEESLVDLHRAQDRLVQQEKLAGLGRMAAGIAHEIKNPLNFVTNFAELSVGLVAEIEAELAEQPERPARDVLDASGDLLADLGANARAIVEHGRRADTIVRSMMEHARAQPGSRRAFDVNDLVEEYATLAADGWRAKEPTRDAEIVFDLDPAAGEVEGAPNELGRVIVNLVTNALDAGAEGPASSEARVGGSPRATGRRSHPSRQRLGRDRRRGQRAGHSG